MTDTSKIKAEKKSDTDTLCFWIKVGCNDIVVVVDASDAMVLLLDNGRMMSDENVSRVKTKKR
jgi:hypothetical protein